MGLLVDGKWVSGIQHNTEKTGGKFVRRESNFRHWVTADGSSGFKAAPGRYHLYVLASCPWAHRTLIWRKLKRLESAISVTIMAPEMSDGGWFFGERQTEDGLGGEPDPLFGATYLHEIYVRADPRFTGRVTVPTLWDKERQTIVSNESSEIVRMLNSAFDAFGDASVDLYPAALCAEIDAINPVIYDRVNNGVYKCGFATTQHAYEDAYDALFATLDQLEARLARRRYLVSDVAPTEADWRLYPTLLRFDVAYYGLFKCNRRRIEDYPNLSNYLRDLFQTPGIAETVTDGAIKRMYYSLEKAWYGRPLIVPLGPVRNLWAPHDRGHFRHAA